MGILPANKIHIAISALRPGMSENTNRTLHTLKTLYICNGAVPKTGYKFHNGLFMDRVYTIPTDVLSCLLDHGHESALPAHLCLGWAVFLFDECCSLGECLVLLRDLCGGFDMQSRSLLTDGQSDMEL